MRVKASIQKQLAIHKFIPLRQRYILTKSNKVRLRYVLPATASLMAAVVVILGTSGVSEAYVSAAYDVRSNPSSFARNAGDFIGPLRDSLAAGVQQAALAVKAPRKPEERSIKLGNGDTVAGVLQKAGVSGTEAYYAVKALTEHYDPRQVKPGQQIALRFDPVGEEEDMALAEIRVKIDPITSVVVNKQEETETFKAVLDKKKVEERTNGHYAVIETSLYGSALKAGIPAPIVAELIRVYSWDVDFQRDIRQGDKIEILYTTYETKDGDIARYGDVQFANLSVGGTDIPVYRYEMQNGDVDYFEADGRSIRKALMKTPIDGARLSSGFGMRRHPVLGYNKMHKGADFAAPTGTPIYAAGDGTIELAGRKGGYGNYVRIRHNSTLKTAYAHMNKFSKKARTGKRVKQGDVIGYVGTTGRSTGPHLHYEVLEKGRQVNPSKVDLPTGEKLKGKDLENFKKKMRGFEKQYVAMVEGVKFAHRDTKDSKTLR